MVTLLAVLAPLMCSAQQASFETLLTNGPASNRLNVVFMSEGYTSSQLPAFLKDATNAINGLLSHQPYTEYSRYVNAFAISVPSPQSGSDHPASGISKNTYFNSSYDPIADTLITIPPDAEDANYADGQGKVDALLQTFMPLCNLPVLLVNEPFYPGGSDGFDRTALASVAFPMSDILTHETGHVLANLGDEYDTPYPGFPDTEEPNTTRQTNRDLVKWKAWIADATPVPTPPTSQYANVVGLFQGAHYHSTGWYRPQLNCLMRSYGGPFCAVCREALVLAIYARVRPIDSFSPALTNLSAGATQTVAFSLNLLQPLTHSLSIQWLTNAAPVPGATNQSFSIPTALLNPGTNLVSATVRDTTDFVRNDPTGLLTQSVTWTLSSNEPAASKIDSPLLLEGGQFVFRISGPASTRFTVQTSEDLTNWVLLQAITLADAPFWYTNPVPLGALTRFYRIIPQP
jgi:IgA Peptidase M64